MLHSRINLVILFFLAVFSLTACSISGGSDAALHPATGEAMSSSIKSAIDSKDYTMLTRLTDLQTFDSLSTESIQKMCKALTSDIAVKSVVFSSKLADDQAQKIDPTDGDVLINFAQPQPFPTRGNATIGNVTQVKLPTMKIDGYYRVHGRRGFGVSDFAM